MKQGMSYTLATATLLALAISAQAEPPRTLVPVADPLDQLQGNLKEARTQAAEDLAAARKALQVAAPKLSERLDNLAEAVKRLEEQTNEITEAVAKDAQTKPEETKELLAEQESINQRLERVKEALRRDANAQDASQKEGRERQRDADDAVAMLENPPRDAEQSLEEAAKAKAPEDQQGSLTTAARHQRELAEALKQLAEHYENVENGEPEKTRAGLRAQEEALGIKEQLDEQYAALEQLMELVNKPPAEALKELEEKLKNNPAMQAELERIAEAALKDAQQDLADAAQNQQQLSEALKQPLPEDPDPIPMAPKPEQLAQAAQAMAEEMIPQIEEANEAAGIEIEEPLQAAQQALQQAAQQGKAQNA